MNYRTYARIDLDAIEYNYNNTRAAMPEGCRIMGVIKADAYGHGAIEIASLLEGKCEFFGVANIDEAMRLIDAGIKTPIIILSYVFSDSYEEIVRHDIRIPVFSYETARALSDEAVRQGRTVHFHFCLDTGMSRIGMQVSEESADLCKKITLLPNIEAEGLFSHYATADEEDLSRALAQQKRFVEFIKMLESREVHIPIKHISNSAGIVNFDNQFDMCRIGIMLYGLYPSDYVNKSVVDVKPVMSWRARVAHVKTLEAGREISYGGTYTTTRESVIATIPVGYADGYPRCLSNKGRVIINGKYADIVGRVCMDQFMVDVTDIPDVSVGSEVILVGESDGASIPMEEIANNAYSLIYEQVCRIAMRVPRVFIYKSKIFKETNYLR